MSKSGNLNIQIALGLSAGSALIYEVVATNFLFFYFTESSYSIATVLSIFLLGLGIGSLFVYKFEQKIANKRSFFSILQISTALYSFLVLANLSEIISKISNTGIYATSFAVLIIPTIFLGAVFPLASSMFKKEEKDVVGLVYFSDLMGAIAGALIAGFFVIPRFGNTAAVMVGLSFNLLSSIFVESGRKKIFPLVFLILSLIGFFKAIDIKNSGYQFFKPSPFGEVSIKNNALSINGREQCSLTYPKDTTERTIADQAILSFKTKDLKVLNIGLGCGLTLSRILDLVSPRVDVVEINPVIVQANRQLSGVLESPRVNLIVDDGLNYLKKTGKTYDVIIIDVEHPDVAHSSNLYTVEAFKLAAEALSDEGVLGFWNYEVGGPYLDILYYTLKESFLFVYQLEGMNVASKQKLAGRAEYIPKTPYAVNTLDHKILIDAYLESIEPIQKPK